MDKPPESELERLRLLEYGDSEAAYPEALWECCPVCAAIKPGERQDNAEFGFGNEKTVGEDLKDPIHRPSGPRHEKDCWLGARIVELEKETD